MKLSKATVRALEGIEQDLEAMADTIPDALRDVRDLLNYPSPPPCAFTEARGQAAEGR